MSELEQRYRAGAVVPYPMRITMALDLRGLDGPKVDVSCRAAEPAVDRWEAGTAVPSWEQLCALADLTEFPVEWFFRPTVGEISPAWFCGTRRCHLVEPSLPVPRFGEPRVGGVVPMVKDTLW